MPKLTKLKDPKFIEAENKRKIRQLERDIKKMQKDFDKTFAVMEDKPKKGRRGSVIAAIIAAIILVIAAALLLGQDGFPAEAASSAICIYADLRI